MYLRRAVRDGKGKQAGLLVRPYELIPHSLAAENHLSSAASGSLDGFSSLQPPGLPEILKTIRVSENVRKPQVAQVFLGDLTTD